MVLKDVPLSLPGVQSREHAVRRNVLSGRTRYPFKFMLLNDYFVLTTLHDAEATRNALKSFNRRDSAKRFTVRQRHEGEWICRRIA